MVDESNIKTVICDRGRETPDGNVVMEEGLSRSCGKDEETARRRGSVAA